MTICSQCGQQTVIIRGVPAPVYNLITSHSTYVKIQISFYEPGDHLQTPTDLEWGHISSNQIKFISIIKNIQSKQNIALLSIAYNFWRVFWFALTKHWGIVQYHAQQWLRGSIVKARQITVTVCHPHRLEMVNWEYYGLWHKLHTIPVN